MVATAIVDHLVEREEVELGRLLKKVNDQIESSEHEFAVFQDEYDIHIRRRTEEEIRVGAKSKGGTSKKKLKRDLGKLLIGKQRHDFIFHKEHSCGGDKILDVTGGWATANGWDWISESYNLDDKRHQTDGTDLTVGECKELCKEHADCEGFEANPGERYGCVFYTGMFDIQPNTSKNCYKRNDRFTVHKNKGCGYLDSKIGLINIETWTNGKQGDPDTTYVDACWGEAECFDEDGTVIEQNVVWQCKVECLLWEECAGFEVIDGICSHWKQGNFSPNEKSVVTGPNIRCYEKEDEIYEWTCESTNPSSAKDSQGNDCSAYKDDEGSCGDYDTSDFKAFEHCCECEGGYNPSYCTDWYPGEVDAVANCDHPDLDGDSCLNGDLNTADFRAELQCCKCGAGSKDALLWKTPISHLWPTGDPVGNCHGPIGLAAEFAFDYLAAKLQEDNGKDTVARQIATAIYGLLTTEKMMDKVNGDDDDSKDKDSKDKDDSKDTDDSDDDDDDTKKKRQKKAKGAGMLKFISKIIGPSRLCIGEWKFDAFSADSFLMDKGCNRMTLPAGRKNSTVLAFGLSFPEVKINAKPADPGFCLAFTQTYDKEEFWFGVGVNGDMIRWIASRFKNPYIQAFVESGISPDIAFSVATTNQIPAKVDYYDPTDGIEKVVEYELKGNFMLRAGLEYDITQATFKRFGMSLSEKMLERLEGLITWDAEIGFLVQATGYSEDYKKYDNYNPDDMTDFFQQFPNMLLYGSGKVLINLNKFIGFLPCITFELFSMWALSNESGFFFGMKKNWGGLIKSICDGVMSVVNLFGDIVSCPEIKLMARVDIFLANQCVGFHVQALFQFSSTKINLSLACKVRWDGSTRVECRHDLGDLARLLVAILDWMFTGMISALGDAAKFLWTEYNKVIAAGVQAVVDIGTYNWAKANGNIWQFVYGTVSDITSAIFNMFESQYTNVHDHLDSGYNPEVLIIWPKGKRNHGGKDARVTFIPADGEFHVVNFFEKIRYMRYCEGPGSGGDDPDTCSVGKADFNANGQGFQYWAVKYEKNGDNKGKITWKVDASDRTSKMMKHPGIAGLAAQAVNDVITMTEFKEAIKDYDAYGEKIHSKGYYGFQRQTIHGNNCLPWVNVTLADGTKRYDDWNIKRWELHSNFCRMTKEDNDWGKPFCYTFEMKKEYCAPLMFTSGSYRLLQEKVVCEEGKTKTKVQSTVDYCYIYCGGLARDDFTLFSDHFSYDESSGLCNCFNGFAGESGMCVHVAPTYRDPKLYKIEEMAAACMMRNKKIQGNFFDEFPKLDSPENCMALCSHNPRCKAVSWYYNAQYSSMTGGGDCQLYESTTMVNSQGYHSLTLDNWAKCDPNRGKDRLNWGCAAHCSSPDGSCDWCGSHSRQELFCCSPFQTYSSQHPCSAADYNAGVNGGATEVGQLSICVPVKNTNYLQLLPHRCKRTPGVGVSESSVAHEYACYSKCSKWGAAFFSYNKRRSRCDCAIRQKNKIGCEPVQTDPFWQSFEIIDYASGCYNTKHKCAGTVIRKFQEKSGKKCIESCEANWNCKCVSRKEGWCSLYGGSAAVFNGDASSEAVSELGYRGCAAGRECSEITRSSTCNLFVNSYRCIWKNGYCMDLGNYNVGLKLSQHWVDDGCVKASDFGDHEPDRDLYPSGLYDDDDVGNAGAGIRCCSLNGSSCTTDFTCTTENTITFTAAKAHCENKGLRLCTRTELWSGICCGTGGQCDQYNSWTSTGASMEFYIPGRCLHAWNHFILKDKNGGYPTSAKQCLASCLLDKKCKYATFDAEEYWVPQSGTDKIQGQCRGYPNSTCTPGGDQLEEGVNTWKKKVDLDSSSGHQGIVWSTKNPVSRTAGGECSTERDIIWDQKLCERAILATFGISGNLNKWVAPGSNYGIPGGCSYKKSDNTMHFNGRVGIDGKGRSDLIPVCLNDNAVEFWAELPDKYFLSVWYPDEGRTLAQAKLDCEADIECKAITCDSNNRCTVRAGSEPIDSWNGETSYNLQKFGYELWYIDESCSTESQIILIGFSTMTFGDCMTTCAARGGGYFALGSGSISCTCYSAALPCKRVAAPGSRTYRVKEGVNLEAIDELRTVPAASETAVGQSEMAYFDKVKAERKAERNRLKSVVEEKKRKLGVATYGDTFFRKTWDEGHHRMDAMDELMIGLTHENNFFDIRKEDIPEELEVNSCYDIRMKGLCVNLGFAEACAASCVRQEKEIAEAEQRARKKAQEEEMRQWEINAKRESEIESIAVIGEKENMEDQSEIDIAGYELSKIYSDSTMPAKVIFILLFGAICGYLVYAKQTKQEETSFHLLEEEY